MEQTPLWCVINEPETLQMQRKTPSQSHSVQSREAPAVWSSPSKDTGALNKLIIGFSMNNQNHSVVWFLKWIHLLLLFMICFCKDPKSYFSCIQHMLWASAHTTIVKKRDVGNALFFFLRQEGVWCLHILCKPELSWEWSHPLTEWGALGPESFPWSTRKEIWIQPVFAWKGCDPGRR